MDSLEPCLYYQFTVQDLPGINILGQLKASSIMKHTHFDCVTSLLAFKTQNWKKILKTYISKQNTTGKTGICNKYLTVAPSSNVKTKKNQNFFGLDVFCFQSVVQSWTKFIPPLCFLLSVDPGLWWYEPWMDR